MSLYKTFKTNENLEKAGILLEYGDASNGKPVAIRIARAGGANDRFGRVLEQKMKPYRKQIQTEVLDEKIGKRIMLEAFAETVVLDWENVELPNADGVLEFAPYSVEACIRLFTDLPDLFADVREQAGKSVLFRDVVREEDAKN